LLLLWLVGINLRTVTLGVPPTLPTLHHAIPLSYAAAGLLSSLPVFLMALGAIPGAYLISRVGNRQAVAIGLAMVTVGAALRAVTPAAGTLFLFTILLGLGIAVSQPALPGLAQTWLPSSVGRAVAVYSNGLLIGEIVAASITLPWLLVPFGWQLALAAWAVPCALLLALWIMAAPPAGRGPGKSVAWLPDWRSGSMLRIGLLMGMASVLYYGMNTWVPDTLDARRSHQLIAPALATLNGMQLPVSVLLALYGQRLVGRRWPYLTAAVGSVVAVLGYALMPAATAPIWTGIIGAASALAFIMTLGLPTLLDPSEVARASGFMFTIGYGTAFVGPAVGGILWDLSGQANGQYGVALVPMGVAALAMLGLGITLPQTFARQRAQPGTSAAAP
jgi:CP family cyanate transporter-like MFS transporter